MSTNVIMIKIVFLFYLLRVIFFFNENCEMLLIFCWMKTALQFLTEGNFLVDIL